MSSFQKWFETFRDEKQYGERFYSVKDDDGVEHLIPTGCVEESILAASPGEQEFIRKTITQIDFHNGDVHHFFEHLATCLAKQYATA